ncbi:hypothetical protein OG211_16745 [Streptomyces niveus]|uniref:hypothetical protein n=1 Tax=Streptomyces niveus TaxID=193462 RepID=UPI0038637556|nr:hypothetical protein OG211_16745 [Streptomyces niveus]
MRIWTELPGRTDVEAVLRNYFGLLRSGRISEAEQLVDHYPVRHVLKSLWTASVDAGTDEDFAADEWERDLSWLGELALSDLRWSYTDSHVSIEISYRARILEVELSFWVKPTDAGWILSGPATYW